MCLLLLQCPSSSWRAALCLRPPPGGPVSLLSLALGAVAPAFILCVGDGGSDVPEDITLAYLSQLPVNITLADPFPELVHNSLSLPCPPHPAGYSALLCPLPPLSSFKCHVPSSCHALPLPPCPLSPWPLCQRGITRHTCGHQSCIPLPRASLASYIPDPVNISLA